MVRHIRRMCILEGVDILKNQNWLQLMTEQNQLANVMKTNQFTEKFGLSLSQEEAGLLIAERKDSLQEQRRVEFGEGILPKLIFAFCDSPYIYQDNYVDTIGRLQDIFYLYKNESMDEATDDELVAYMKTAFDGECEGSLEHLEDTVLEKFAREIRKHTSHFMSKQNTPIKWEPDEDE